MHEITITLSIPQTWKNAAWYENEQIDVAWVQGKIEEALSYMEEVCGISLDRAEHEFRGAITAFRNEQAENEQARKKRWEYPIYRQAQYDMLTRDDLPKIRAIMENAARTAAEAIQKRVEEIVVA
jgi:hypothetical protein